VEANSVNIFVGKNKSKHIKKCCRRADILNDDMSSVVPYELEDDLFYDQDDTAHEYNKGDKDIPVCIDTDNNSMQNWYIQ